MMKRYQAEVEMPTANPVFQLHEVYLVQDVEVWRTRNRVVWLRVVCAVVAVTFLFASWVMAGEARAYDTTIYGNCSMTVDGITYPCAGSHEPYRGGSPDANRKCSGVTAPPECYLPESDQYCLGSVAPNQPVYRIRPGCFVEAPRHRCLAVMEAAMRAMEPFIMTQWYLSSDEEYRKQRLEELQKAETAWHHAKQQCWGKP